MVQKAASYIEINAVVTACVNFFKMSVVQLAQVFMLVLPDSSTVSCVWE